MGYRIHRMNGLGGKGVGVKGLFEVPSFLVRQIFNIAFYLVGFVYRSVKVI